MTQGQFSFRAIKKAVASGHLVLDPDAGSCIEVYNERNNIGDPQAFKDLMQYMSEQPDTASRITPFIVDESVSYCEEEVQHLHQVKRDRGLTEDEKRYAMETLKPLIASMSQFASEVGVPNSNP